MHVNRILASLKTYLDKMNALTVKSYSLIDTVLKKMVGGVIGAFVILIVLLKKQTQQPS